MPPKHAIIAVTYKCNGRCVMCNIWKKEHTEEVAIDVFGCLPPSLKTINITGGEPFLRKDLPSIVSLILRRCNNPRMVISTNGLSPSIIEAQLNEIKRFAPNVGIRISVDGLGEMHDRIRGVKGAFDRTMESVEVCKKMNVKDLGLAFTIIPENLDHLRSVYDLTRKNNLQFAVSIAQNSDIYFSIDTLKPQVDSKVLADHLEYIAQNQLKALDIKNWFRAYFTRGIYYYNIGQSPLIACSAADDFFFFDPQGNVFICPILDVRLGNLKKSEFNVVWVSKEGQAARKFAPTCPRRCWMACTVAPFIKRNMLKTILWIISKKIAVHMGKKIISK